MSIIEHKLHDLIRQLRKRWTLADIPQPKILMTTQYWYCSDTSLMLHRHFTDIYMILNDIPTTFNWHYKTFHQYLIESSSAFYRYFFDISSMFHHIPLTFHQHLTDIFDFVYQHLLTISWLLNDFFLILCFFFFLFLFPDCSIAE